MANLKEFNFQHQTVAPLESHHPQPPRAGASAPLAPTHGEEEGKITSGGGGQSAKNFQAEQPRDSQVDAC